MESRDKPFFLVAIVILYLLTSALLPLYFKPLFVDITGRLIAMEPWLAVLLILALLFKRNWSRKVTRLFNILGACMLTVALIGTGFNDYKFIGLLFLLLLQALSNSILRHTAVKGFLNH